MGHFDVDAPKNDEAEADLSRIRDFFTSLQWWKLEPADSLVAENSGDHCYCLSETGKIYVVYTEGTTSATLNLVGAPPEDYSVRSFDPRSGAYTELPGHSGSGSVRLQVPSTDDWVFLIERKSQ